MRAIRRTWWMWASLVASAGCQTPSSMPADPLFVTKKPMEAKAQAGPPSDVAFFEPNVPSDPYQQRQRREFAERSVPGIQVLRAVMPPRDEPRAPLPVIHVNTPVSLPRIREDDVDR